MKLSQSPAAVASRRYYRGLMRQWALLWRAMQRPEHLLCALTLRNTAARFSEGSEQLELFGGAPGGRALPGEER